MCEQPGAIAAQRMQQQRLGIATIDPLACLPQQVLGGGGRLIAHTDHSLVRDLGRPLSVLEPLAILADAACGIDSLRLSMQFHQSI
ncbi:hypothetical protein LL965_00630 [Xanthomonas cassavae CFBP 4642]|uniref:Uncharacterized protein n=1 Tax=Xanthomonas cassavae CFBP 4642 TaxID=1219375 RepID=A0ABS8HD95_9XANT|nr:hypothetical protein [Xanthomonas cassavae]MCC4618652.1 hypothetical protein [Xanthomonas cassavae CFBP 4642]